MRLGERAVSEPMLSFWAKSGRDGDAVPMHSVPHHCLDVAAAAFLLLAQFPPPVAGVPALWVAALAALHDIGKFTRPFQAKVPALWPACLGPLAPGGTGWSHDLAGYALLNGRALRARLDPLFSLPWEYGERVPVLAAIAGHHGRPPEPPDRPDLPRNVACRVCLDTAGAWIDAVLHTLEPPPLPALTERDTAALVWWLAGLTTLADWIGSSRAWFPAVPAAEHADFRAYWTGRALPQARAAVAASGLLLAPWRAAGGMAGLFPDLAASARPLQRWAETAPLPAGPVLVVIEDATGAGKTEAALILAHRLIAAGAGDGLYLALPTMATANAMFDRMVAAYERLVAPEGRASLVLAHGRRAQSERFTDLVLDAIPDGARMQTQEPADQPGAAQCAAWIADDRRKSFLAAIGVGTIDQAWLAVLPSRHAMLRLLGLARRVLIIDEAHAYDGYEGAELQRLLGFHAALGGSAIVLSATLTAAQRRELTGAFRTGLGAGPAVGEDTDTYPLATIAAREGVRCDPVRIAPALVRSVRVTRIASSEDAADRVAAAAREGAAVAWVRNAVDDVLEAEALLRGRDCAPLVFHARFALGDRLAIEDAVLARSGRASGPEARRGFVLLATQVLQESLDCDFDLLVSDLAPADLVIQRAGRLWRHERAGRPVAGPHLHLLAPDPVDNPPRDWLGPALRRTGFVYADHALLWRSARVLLRAGAIETPGNLRALVEAAYDRDSAGSVPEGLAAADLKAEGSEAGERAVARATLLRFDKPYAWDAGLWAPDHRTPTRLADPMTTLRLARLEGGRVVPWCADATEARAWALSEVAIRTARVAAAAPSDADAPIERVRCGWPQWDRERPVLVLRPGENGLWHGAGLDGRGRAVALTYGRVRGLSFG